jgi:ubiquinone/menaquinone biosynthesis C-methylase UbiE
MARMVSLMPERERWQLGSDAAQQYEIYKVPRLFRPLALRLLERMALRPGERVLDAACGTGIVARLAAQQVAPDGSVAALDFNEAMLAVAREHASGGAAAPIEWRKGDCAALPFAARSFDAVLCQQALQFLLDKERALAEMRRVLVSRGRIGLDVFGAPSAYSAALSEALARHVDAQAAARSLTPFALADAEALSGMLRKAGFADVDVHTNMISRRVEPTQEWLLQDTAGTPYGASIVEMNPAARAQMLREIAAQLRNYWSGDCFAVPTEVHFAYAFNKED